MFQKAFLFQKKNVTSFFQLFACHFYLVTTYLHAIGIYVLKMGYTCNLQGSRGIERENTNNTTSLLTT